ncbi:response regulator [Thauera linaloolentis 47Lol = DSM 12138]|uniref:Response regulator n=1 Tax=Thauera linaloolentis (strain DSM 12138 / JCM 21573 / CCUG 41526 / CIP 105981 / IAM 15112 / NBRC 102519 / 47Lol) TaxID=1123367 RepID=N6Z329_THAL4|nr:response regulator [Thauera linaloolentis 47Lol = DSM 12138]
MVDDDPALCRSLRFLLETEGWPVCLFDSAEAFLDALGTQPAPSQPCCLLLDIRMPAMSGLELQQVLRNRGFDAPILFMTGHADVSMAVQAMKCGACDFIEKPFNDQAVLDAVAGAVRRCADMLDGAHRRDTARAALSHLSPREQEVAHLVARGQPNKLIAAELGISEKTVHIHRQHVMEKAGVSSAAELARLFLRVDPGALD